MEFHEYLCLYDFAKRYKIAKTDPLAWYAAEIERSQNQAIALAHMAEESAVAHAVSNIQMSCEQEWLRVNRPYYKIYPSLLPYFVNTKLNVPSEFFGLPFPSFVIRLPAEHNVEQLRLDDKHFVKTILVGGWDGKLPAWLIGNGIEHQYTRQLILFIDINEIEQLPGENDVFFPVLTYQQLLFNDDKQTIEEALITNTQNCKRIRDNQVIDGGIPVPLSVSETCLRIAVATALLATGGDQIVEHDVLNRDLQTYIQAKQAENQETQRKIVQRAVRNHKHGFTIGREILFPRRKERKFDGEEGDGQELQFQHERSAHWHWVRYGPGKAKMSLKFFGQVTVRPDLPINPKPRGYKTAELDP
jgi:hypothetical protein